MATMTRCDKDGVPCIVQGFSHCLGAFRVRLFNGNIVYVDLGWLFCGLPFDLLKHEVFEYLENYFNNNLHLIKLEETK